MDRKRAQIVPHYKRRHVFYIATMTVLLALSGYATIVHGQTPQPMNSKTMEGHRLMISPKFVSVDPVKKTATLELENQTSDTLDSELFVTAQAPLAFAFGRQTQKKKSATGSSKGLLSALIEDEQTKDTNDEIPEAQSLVPWVKGVPSHILLAPGDKRIVTVSIEVPENTKPGEYFCWVIARSTSRGPKKVGGFAIVGPDGKPISMPSFTKLSLTIATTP